MKTTELFVIFTILLGLTFCSTVTAHPGHGEHYPEEVTNETPTSAPTTPSSTRSTSPNKVSTVNKKSIAPEEDSKQIKNTDTQDTTASAGNQPVEDLKDSNSSTNATPSAEPDNSSWNIILIIGGLISGFWAVGLLFKLGILK